VLLDGLEFLIAHNDFSSILALLHDLDELVSISESILLIPIDPRTLGEREFALASRETRIISPPGPSPKIDVQVARSPAVLSRRNP